MSLINLGLQEVYLDLHSRFIGSFFAKEGERNARGLLVNVLDNSKPVTLTGMTAKMYVQVADDRVYESDATITNNRFRIIYPTNLLKSGKAKAEIRIYIGVDNIASRTFEIDIERAILSEDLIQGDNELGLIEQLRVAMESEDTRLANEQVRQTNELARERLATQLKEDNLVHNLDTGKEYSTKLEIKDGRPRLRMEEI